ncbi:MAG: 50S ribosomal protein L28 [Lachnospiraceae bacterium]|jgi:large subunit ribosomal protein L28|nr:50S ribosomal protein L28 [Lachnospiraceae bacterium]MBR2532222.1 50S ribosomal protein L28 [Lachnospiraceae bacterium]
MAKCSVCGKSVLFGNAVSHSHRRSNKIFKPNVKRVNIQTETGNKRVYVCTSCLRSGRVQRAEVVKSAPVVAPAVEAVAEAVVETAPVAETTEA